MDPPSGLLAGLGEAIEKKPPVLVVTEDRFPAITAIHDMVSSAGKFDAKRSRHARSFAKGSAPVNMKWLGLTPLPLFT